MKCPENFFTLKKEFVRSIFWAKHF